MAKRNTTTKQSSGGGFQFENEVVAYVLAHLLTRFSPFHPPGGVVEQIEVQKPATEWHLDDLVVTVRTHGRRHRLAFSIKSNEQVSQGGFPPDFVGLAWEHILHDSSPVFDESRDYLGLITAPLDLNLKKAISELLGLAREQSPSNLAAQIELPNRTNDIVRNLFRSAECPEELATKYGVEKGSAGRLLRRMAWLPLDFEDENSGTRARALELCQHLLRSGSADEASFFWTSLKDVADRLRRFGGDIDLGRLVDKLRGQYALRHFPDHGADWERLSEDTKAALRRIRSTIGGTVTLPRVLEQEAVNQAFEKHRVVILLGGSGFGKSVIAKAYAQIATAEGPVFWLDASRLSAHTFAEWRTYLGLDHPLAEIVRTTPASRALLVLDGLDRLYRESDLATIAEFIQSVRLGEEASPWRLLITCTPEAWGRVQDEITSRAGWPARPTIVNIGSPADNELVDIWSAFPQLRPLATRHHLTPVLLRPKVLDLLATRASQAENLAIVGESDLASWFWKREVACGPHAVLWAETASRFARHLADTLTPDISISAVATAVGMENVSGIDELIDSRLLRCAEDRVAFDHDLYADWVRVRQLLDMDEAGQFSNFLAHRLDSPVWHRALRLYGLHLLEQSDDLTRWTSALKTIRNIPAPAGTLAQDILLESSAFASGGTGLFRDGLWPLLVENNGVLLERLLNRLLHAATIPNPAAVDAMIQQNPELAIHAAAWARLPYPYYWFGILSLLCGHREEIPPRVRGLAARMADLWLRATDQSWALRKEAATLAVTLGEVMLKAKEEDDRLFDDREADQQVYRAILASGYEERDAVTQIVLEASGRRRQQHAPPKLSEEEIAARRAKYAASIVSSLSIYRGPLPAPWPHGPAFRVDGALQVTVLDSDALKPLTQSLPELAREVLLALLIQEPKHHNSFDIGSPHELFSLEKPPWHPPFYTRGPFRTFLATAEAEAVTAILQLIEHATERWVEFRAHYIARERECSPSDIEIPTVPIRILGKDRGYIGVAQVFAWSQHGPDNGGVIESALCALEKHLYDRVDAGDDVTPLIERLLTESHSLAVVGVLSVFGRRHPYYLHGPLQGLLVSPHVLQWTLMGSAATGWEWSFSLVPTLLQAEYRTWHEMPHRKISLRDLALYLFVNNPSLRPFFNEARQNLQAGLQPGGPYEGWTLVESFVARLNPGNYSKFVDEDGKTYYQYSHPEELRHKYAEEDRASQTELLLATLPLQCRQRIDSNEPVPAEELDRLRELSQRISEVDPEKIDDVISPVNSLAGIAAVFIRHGKEWLTEHPDHAEWARRTLVNVAQENREADAFYGSVVPYDRLVFAIEALPVIWANDPNARYIRETIARIASHAPPKLVGFLTSGVAAVREHLTEDHLRLLHLVLLRAGLEPRIIQAERRARWGTDDSQEGLAEDGASLRSQLSSFEHDFVEGTLKAIVPSLDEVASLQPLSEERPTRRPHRRRAPHRLLEESLLVAAYRGVPDPGDNTSFWSQVWERIVLDTVSPLTPTDNEQTEDLDESLGQWAYFFLERIAGVVASTDDSVAARRLWQPIIDLGASASQWVSLFSRHWADYVLFKDARESVVKSWIAMIDSALANPHWSSGDGYTIKSHHTGELWRNLFGFAALDSDTWTDQLRPRVRLIRGQLDRWAESYLTNSDNVRAFARFLTLPAAVDLVFDGLIWLDSGSQSLSHRYRMDSTDHMDDAVFSLLAHVWRVAQEELRRQETSFRAFKNLLQTLVSRQHGPALELADRVGWIAH